jgi:hypothetical protein
MEHILATQIRGLRPLTYALRALETLFFLGLLLAGAGYCIYDASTAVRSLLPIFAQANQRKQDTVKHFLLPFPGIRRAAELGFDLFYSAAAFVIAWEKLPYRDVLKVKVKQMKKRTDYILDVRPPSLPSSQS